MIIRSTYRNYGKNFELEVVGECLNENKEECYLVRLLPQYQNDFQEKDTITQLRKNLIGHLYEIIEEPQYIQLTLF